MAETIIWSVDAYGRNPVSAAGEFASTYWDKPRRVGSIDSQGRFTVRGGRATYTVRLVQEPGRLAVYQVTRE
jgi:hypothetical protein